MKLVFKLEKYYCFEKEYVLVLDVYGMLYCVNLLWLFYIKNLMFDSVFILWKFNLCGIYGF